MNNFDDEKRDFWLDDEPKRNERRKGGSHFAKQKSVGVKRNNFKVVLALIIAIIVFVTIYSTCFASSVELIGEENETANYGVEYKDKGIVVKKGIKNISNKVIKEGNVNSNKIGKYTVTYTIPGSKKKYTRTVTIADIEAPEVKLEGEKEMTISYGTEFIEPGYSASDRFDGDVTDKVEVSKVEKDANTIEYHYIVTDSSNNKADVVRTVKITDDVAPKITLKGGSNISVLINTEYKEQGATVEDNKDGDLSDKVQISGSVDTTKEGTYTLTYTVSDNNGNTAETKRNVKVGEKISTGTIYLTFDDGPSANITPHILDILKEKGVKATFFIINYSDANAELVKRASDEGHTIAIHGYSHDYAKIYKSPEACYENITKLQEKIYNTTGVRTKIIRFPGGSSNTVSRKYCSGIMTTMTKKVLSEGFKYYDWNVASGDSGDVKTSEAVYNNVTKGIKPERDNIVLMHDFSGNTKTLNALANIIDYGLNNGYSFEPITIDTPMVTQKVLN